VSHWKEARLGDLTTVISSGATPLGGASSYDSNGPVLFIRSQNVLMNRLDISDAAYVSEETDRRLARTRVEFGDVLLNITGASIGRVSAFHKQGTRANVNQHVCVIRPKPELLFFGFLSRYISSPEFQAYINRVQAGGTRQALNFSQIANFTIPLPPLAEQRRIAVILHKAETVRAKRTETLSRSANLASTLFRQMFGDPIANEKGWRGVRVADFVAGFEGGKSLVSEDEDDHTTLNRVLKISAVTSLRYRPEEAKPIPDTYQPPSQHFVRQGDLLFSRANTSELVGATAFVFKTPLNILLPDKLWRFVWQESCPVDPLFVWYMFQHESFRREIGKRATGTSGSMKNISQAKTMLIETILPPVEKQRTFGKFVRSMEQLSQHQNDSASELDSLFACLQHRAFRGEL
jgi:type I restriction enzyme S subunit